MDRNVNQKGMAVTLAAIMIGLAFFAFPNQASAQGVTPLPRLNTNRIAPSARVGSIVIRGIPYQDHSAGTSLGPRTIPVNGSFTITSSTLNFNTPGTLKVVLQDASRPGNSYGFTVFQLSNVRRAGNRLLVQGPGLPIFRNRTFHVTVFLYTGSSNLYASAGTITFQ